MTLFDILSRNSNKLFCIAFAAYAMFIGSNSVIRAEEWVQVASGGFGISDQVQPDAMAIFDNYIYLATSIALPGGEKQPKIYRAAIRDDTVWSEFSPPWGAAGEVTDMVIFQDRLYVSNSDGQIWRLAGGGSWVDVTPDWPGSGIVHSMAPMLPRAGGFRLCVVRGGIEIWCGTPGGTWDQITVPPGFDDDPTIQNAVLRRLGRNLYLGVGGESAGSRQCEVWKLTTPERFTTSVVWSPVTTVCFGFGDDLTWVPAMAEFDFMLYIGTAGHGATAVVYRTDGSELEDVTPCTLYADCSDFAAPPLLAPVRYGSMAATGDRIYVGTRTPSLPGELMGADVIFTGDGGLWERSNEPGFGVMGNDAVTALGSDRGHLYAGVLNIVSGLEVWRRTPALIELLPFMLRDLKEMAILKSRLQRCLSPPSPFCPFNLVPIALAFEMIHTGFDKAAFDDEELLQEIKKTLGQAESHLEEAERLAALAEKENNPRTVRKLRIQSLHSLDEAIKITRSALNTTKKAIQKK
jgi:hypothetical protein